MKRRLFSLLVALPVLLSLGIGSILPKVALADSLAYAFNYDQSQSNVTAMSKAANMSELGGGDGRSDDASFDSSQVIARGGFFGAGKAFTYARLVKDFGYQYISSYYCVNGAPQTKQPDSSKQYYKVEVSIYLDLRQDFYKQPTERYEAAVSRIDYFDGNGVNTTSTNWSATNGGYPLWSNAGPEGTPAMPSSCIVPNFSLPQDEQGTIAYTSSPPVTNLVQQANAGKDVSSWTTTLKSINAGTIGTPSGATGGGTGNGGSDAPKLSCTIGSFTGIINPLNWVLCPAISGMSDIIGFVDNSIVSQLSVGSPGGSDNPSQIFCESGTCNAYHAAWASFRDIALGLMVVAGLIIVISQALGMEILDAYTVRKTLPRLLIAAIGITLSWQLMAFFVKLTNDLGYGVRALIYYPFTQALGNSITIDASSWSANGASLLAGIGYLAIGAFGLLTLAASGALALLVAFFVLVLRQIAIIVLIILAPVAIFAYVLPNTQNVYKLWWDSFSRALLMFPIIAGFIAAGHVFSLVAISNNGGHPTALYQFAAFVAYFAPYFLIPATFKLAGGAIRQIGGFVNDRSRGGFDMLRNARSNNTKKRVQAARTGGIYRKDFGEFGKVRADGTRRSVGQMLNSLGDWSLDLDERSRLELGRRNVPGFKRGAEKMEADIGHARIEQNKKAAQEAGPDYRLGWAIGSNFDRFKGFGVDEYGKARNGGLNREQFARVEEAFGTGPRDSSGMLVRDENGEYHGGYRKVVGNDLKNLEGMLAQGTDGSDATFAAMQLHNKSGTLKRLTDNDNDETRRADLHSMGVIMAASEGRLEDSELHAVNAPGDHYSNHLFEEAQRLTTQKRPEFAVGHGARVRSVTDANGNTHQEYYSVYDQQHFESDEAKKALLRLKPDEPQMGKAEFWDTTSAAWMHHAKEGEADVIDPVTRRATGKKTYSDSAKAMRSFIVRQAGYYSRSDPGAQLKVEQLKRNLGITADEEREYMSGWRPDDPRNAQGAPPPAEPPESH